VTLSILSWLRDSGVLGMNQRNGEYIMGHNPRSAYPLVDDKLLTKRLAVEHGLPTPALLHVIQYHGDIATFDETLRGRSEFVVKPARGAGGSGIMLIAGRNDQGFVKQNDEIVPPDEFYYALSGILSGIYSLEGREDRAIIEALVHPDPVFESVTFRGVPDIRIVVYKGVPAMAMTRLPTQKSDGKANLHRGAIGVGIDIGRGITLGGVNGTSLVDRHPDTSERVTGISVPYWEEMLVIAAKAVDMTGLGYLGVDLIIDREKGPLLLELNARPGLQIQVANQSGLKKRLDLIENASSDVFVSPEARVAWARDAFTREP
jgi:alpha-L-glutamate ligase-like protein